MATNKQRREAERERLRRQLEQRRQREQSRKRFTLVASIVGTLVVIAAVVLTVVLVVTGGDDENDDAAGRAKSTTPAAPASSSPEAQPCSTKGLPGVVSFDGVDVGNARTLTKEPKVCAAGKSDPTALQVKDLVVGKGKAPALTSTVSVQYTGVIYRSGVQFDSSWTRGQPASFNLQQVVPGFTQGIGGNQKNIAPMKIGGRRIVIMPGSLGYGANGNPQAGIGPNAPLVFVIDLKAVK